VVVAALSTGHKIGLLVVALTFIGFSLLSAFVFPRRNPDFPGDRGLSVFVVTSIVLFALMIGAVEVFAVESEAHHGTAAKHGHTK